MYVYDISAITAISFLGETHRPQFGALNICEYSENCLLYFISVKKFIL